jgi:hypothetical protein
MLSAIACVALCACDVRTALARYPPPPAGSFTASTVRVSADGTTESTSAAVVTRDFFRAYSMSPRIGRLFLDVDFAPGSRRLAVLTDALWRRRFGAGPDAIGREIEIDGTRVTIIAVMPPDFDLPRDAQLWLNR